MHHRQSSRPVLALALVLLTSQAQAQFYATCREATPAELDASIRAHEEHSVRLHEKFITGWYRQGSLPSSFRPITRQQIEQALGRLGERRAAVLFQAYQNGRFCSWLISPDGKLVSHRADLSEADLRRLQPGMIQALGVRDQARGHVPERKRGSPAGKDSLDNVPAAESVLHDAAKLLLPSPIRQTVLESPIDTLVVVPLFETGTLPFAALPVDAHRALVDVASVMVAPGLFVFRQPPIAARETFPEALIVGNPVGWKDPDWDFDPLPGAEREAGEVASLVQASPLLGHAATKGAVRTALTRHPALIYLATHGIADDANPLDQGFLLLSDGRWPAREIAKAPLSATRPLVVMSACQSGLGKNFEVGTIGLARAWHQAGASNVVMSLWNVGDASTAQLMTRFAALLRTSPPDRALQQAMRDVRKTDSAPAHWASFAVFGLPEQPQHITKPFPD
jgi:CHAT domain-containing protein